jgi:uncharacterized repeat protein (TIGR01451 family)
VAVVVNLPRAGRSDHLAATNGTSAGIECTLGNSVSTIPGSFAKIGSSSGPLLPGDSFSYQLDLEVGVMLEGNGLSGVVRGVVDPLPADFLLGSLVENEVTGSGITCSAPSPGSSGTVTCTFDTPQDEFSGSIDLFGEVAGDAAPGLLTNTATFQVNATFAGQPLLCRASSTWEVEIVSPANVTADKTVSGDFSLGGTVTYTVVLTNSGPAAQVDAPGDELTDVLPPELELDCGGATTVVSGGGTLQCFPATNTVTWNGSIPAAGSVTIAIAATIQSGVPGVPIENQGSFQFDASGDGVHDTNGTTDDPGTPPAPDPTALVLGFVASDIPTAGVVALMALALLLAVAALPRLRD